MDVEAEEAAAAALFLVNLGGDTFDSLEIPAFRSWVLTKEAITIEYDGGSSYLSSVDDARDDEVCVVTTDA